MNEAEGARILAECFERAGLTIARDVRWQEGGVDVTLDGWDAARRIGFELITTEAGDREEFTPAVVAELEARMEREELFLFLVDERVVPSAEALTRAAEGFLAVLRDRAKLP
ncbi:MAG: hypothetical protein KIT84_33880 [Labilithrix sp.]|nr:hypothetical protein [Labilithrix sp.]MCW5816037.1 hypothetical protein [Labilithrix sp.]